MGELDLVRDLVEWHRRWPKGRVYGFDRFKQCEDELDALCARAETLAAPRTNDAAAHDSAEVAKRVPREPTPEMVQAGFDEYWSHGQDVINQLPAIYRAMYDAFHCDAPASVQTDHESQPATADNGAGKSPTDRYERPDGLLDKEPASEEWIAALAAQPEQPAAPTEACPQCLDTGVARYPYCTTCGKRAAAPIEAPPREQLAKLAARWITRLDKLNEKPLVHASRADELALCISDLAAAQTGQKP